MTDLDDRYGLVPEQIDRFRRDGYLKLDGVFAPKTIARIRTAILAAVARHYPSLHTTTNPERSFSQLFDVWVDGVGARPLTFSHRLGRLACELLDVDGVRVIHDQALLKEPGDRPTRWHADQHYWPIDSDRTCSFWVPLQPTSLEMGPVTFAAGSQLFAGRRIASADPLDEQVADDRHRRVIEQEGYAVVEEPYAAGDVSVHAGWTLHHAGANRTQAVRAAYVLHLMDSNARFAAPVNREQEGHIALFHWGGLQVGQRLEVAMCPLIPG